MPPKHGAMIRFRLPALSGVALAVLALTAPADSAFAAGCLSAGEARAAVQQGQARPLSSMLKSIRAQAGGEVLPSPQLCDLGGGRLVYYVNVLAKSGEVKRLTVDASSGSIIGN